MTSISLVRAWVIALTELIFSVHIFIPKFLQSRSYIGVMGEVKEVEGEARWDVEER